MRFCTDRTAADVENGTSKGCYTYLDLNRVEQAVETLCKLTPLLDISLQLRTVTDWGSAQEIPTRAEMVRYLENIRSLTRAVNITVPLPETMEYLDFSGANQMEIALQQAEFRIRSILQTYQMSGELIAGEENGI